MRIKDTGIFTRSDLKDAFPLFDLFRGKNPQGTKPALLAALIFGKVTFASEAP